MPYIEVKKDVYAIYIPHWNATYFESFTPLSKGTSYIYYVVRGNNRVALIDTAASIKVDYLLIRIINNNETLDLGNKTLKVYFCSICVLA